MKNTNLQRFRAIVKLSLVKGISVFRAESVLLSSTLGSYILSRVYGFVTNNNGFWIG
jgi:hypothetical protein